MYNIPRSLKAILSEKTNLTDFNGNKPGKLLIIMVFQHLVLRKTFFKTTILEYGHATLNVG